MRGEPAGCWDTATPSRDAVSSRASRPPPPPGPTAGSAAAPADPWRGTAPPPAAGSSHWGHASALRGCGSAQGGRGFVLEIAHGQAQDRHSFALSGCGLFVGGHAHFDSLLILCALLQQQSKPEQCQRRDLIGPEPDPHQRGREGKKNGKTLVMLTGPHGLWGQRTHGGVDGFLTFRRGWLGGGEGCSWGGCGGVRGDDVVTGGGREGWKSTLSEDLSTLPVPSRGREGWATWQDWFGVIT